MKNRNKSQIWYRLEHVFEVVMSLWGFGKMRYEGLAKSATRAFTAPALTNLYLSCHRLMAQVRREPGNGLKSPGNRLTRHKKVDGGSRANLNLSVISLSSS